MNSTEPSAGGDMFKWGDFEDEEENEVAYRAWNNLGWPSADDDPLNPVNVCLRDIIGEYAKYKPIPPPEKP